MSTFEEIRDLVADALQLADRSAGWSRETQLLGALPEFDSQSVVYVITSIEDQYGFVVEDDEMKAETFETLGSLVDFVEARL